MHNVLIVEKAKAEAEGKRLQGQGIADQEEKLQEDLKNLLKFLTKLVLIHKKPQL